MRSLPNDPKDLMRPTAQPGAFNGLAPYPSTYSSSYTAAADPDGDGFLQYWRILSRNKGRLFLAAMLGMGAGFLLTLPQAPVYRAQTSLEIQNLNEDFLNIKNVSPTAPTSPIQSPEYNIRTQTSVLQSRPVLERAISRLQPEEQQLLSGKPTGIVSAIRTKLGIGSNEPVAEGERAITTVENNLKVQTEPNTRVIKVTFDSTSPNLAAGFVNVVADSFIQLSLEWRLETSQRTVEWLMRQMQAVKAKLKKSEEDLQQFAHSANLTFLDEKENIAEERLKQLQADVTKAQADAVVKQAKYELAATAPAESLPEVLDDPTLKDYQVELTNLRRQLAELTSQYTPQHPKVVKVQAQMVALESALEKKRANIVSRIRNDYMSSRRQERLLSSNYSSQLGLMTKQASKVSQYADLKREVDSTRQLYDSMYQRVTEAGLASALRASDIRIIEQAKPPRMPYKPNFILNSMLGLLFGTLLGTVIVIHRARADRGIQEPGDTTLHLNVPELGVIPATTLSGQAMKKLIGSVTGADAERLELATFQQRYSLMAESFRLTLTSILLSGQNGGRPRVIVLTSANPREGKTTVISNLAIALAQANHRVLLIDGDLRRPRMHEIFGAENRGGLSDVLTGKSPLEVRETKIPNLHVLPSGQCDDMSLLFTPDLRTLLKRVKAEFDMVLIDTPPMLQMPDARLIGRHADAIILVVAQHTTRDAVGLACQKIAEDGSVLLGTILNNWDAKGSMHSYAQQGDHYSQYYRHA